MTIYICLGYSSLYTHLHALSQLIASAYSNRCFEGKKRKRREMFSVPERKFLQNPAVCVLALFVLLLSLQFEGPVSHFTKEELIFYGEDICTYLTE